MSTDLIPHPRTGEALDLTADTETLAAWIDELREYESRSKEIRERIGAELVRRMDQSAKWTIHANGFKVTAPSPAPKVQWDAEALRPVLLELVFEGLISEEASDAALEVVLSYKAKPAGLNALLKLGGPVAERLSECRSEVEPVRRVSVKSDR